MPATPKQPHRLVEYDAVRHRLWILGQRCHHGATGSLVAGVACVGLAVERHLKLPLATLFATGGLLMVHDWKDKGVWFQRGYGTQP